MVIFCVYVCIATTRKYTYVVTVQPKVTRSETSFAAARARTYSEYPRDVSGRYIIFRSYGQKLESKEYKLPYTLFLGKNALLYQAS